MTELIRSLPKELRRLFVPAPDTARAVLPGWARRTGDLLDALGAELGRLGGVQIPRDAWDLSRLPAHLRITFRVVDDGQVLASGQGPGRAAPARCGPGCRRCSPRRPRGLTRTGLRDWDIGTLPRVFTHGQVTAYPALADTGDAVDVRLFETEAEAGAAMLRGTRRLLLLQVPSGVRVDGRPAAGQRQAGHEPAARTRASARCSTTARRAAADQVIADAGGPAWDADGLRAAGGGGAGRRWPLATARRGGRRRPGARGGARGRGQAAAAPPARRWPRRSPTCAASSPG